MKLANVNEAEVPWAKIVLYLLNPEHRSGKGKARSRPLEEVLARILRGHTSDTLEPA